MNKLIVSYIDAYMGNAAGVGVCEEYQISGLQGRLGDLSSNSPLLLGGAGQGDAVAVKYILHQSGAVETAGGASTPDIRNADVLF